MEVKPNIDTSSVRRPLRDLIRVVIAYFGCLVVLSVYHHLRLYSAGVIDSVINKSFFLLVVHHLGFASITALFVAFFYSFLELRKTGAGFNFAKFFFITLLVIEAILVEFYVLQYEILSLEIFNRLFSSFGLLQLGLFLLMFTTMGMVLFPVLYKYTARSYKLITRLYPITFILFTFFLATLIIGKKPVNENKLQHLLVSAWDRVLEDPEYDGDQEFPLARKTVVENSLLPYFNDPIEDPNIIVVMVEGLSSSFVGPDAPYREFMPFLNSLQQQSLEWTNALSNGAEAHHALPSVMGSLPFGESGFTNISPSPGRNTLFSILEDNGYQTSFYYGGNSALQRVDKFLFEEKVDRIVDVKSYGSAYTKQEEDQAGVSLGYPDRELFRKYREDLTVSEEPFLDVFLTQSTRKPYLIPESGTYEALVEDIISKDELPKRSQRIVKRNKELMASFIYADRALEEFCAMLKKRPGYNNTVILITGTHKTEGLPQLDNLERYRVPLLMFSPLLKNPAQFNHLVSHADIAPSLLGLLHRGSRLRLPAGCAWLGYGLGKTDNKPIPLIRYHRGLKEYILGNTLVSQERYYTINETGELSALEDDNTRLIIDSLFTHFKRVNRYVTKKDKLIPEAFALVQSRKGLSKEEMIWVHSVFNGSNYDQAYNTARKLAFKGEKERALLLCEHIMMNVPGHVDTEILMGRIHAWDRQFGLAERILKECIRKYPLYTDSYAALLDVYYWAGINRKALAVERSLKSRNIEDRYLQDKIERAKKQMDKAEREEMLSDMRSAKGRLDFEDL